MTQRGLDTQVTMPDHEILFGSFSLQNDPVHSLQNDPARLTHKSPLGEDKIASRVGGSGCLFLLSV